MKSFLVVLSLFACRSRSAPVAPLTPDSVWAAHEVHVTGVVTGPACTVLALHGRGDTPSNFWNVFQDYPGDAQFLLPQAPLDPDMKRPSWFAGSREVSDAALGEQIGMMADALVDGVGSAPLPHPIQGKPIVTGFSQGGMLSFAIATRRPDAVGAAFPMGGMLPTSLLPPGGGDTPITAFHGTADAVIPFQRVQATHDHLKAKGWPVTLRPYDGVQHRIPPQMRAALFDAIDEVCATRSNPR